jgi:hypothetical protein
MNKENLIHIRFGYGEAFQAKRDILSSQMILLKMAKTMEGYNFYRSKEFELKSVLYKKIKELKMDMGRLQKILPKPKIPDILKEKWPEKTEPIPIRKTKFPERSLEEQLQEIQSKLDELQGRRV